MWFLLPIQLRQDAAPLWDFQRVRVFLHALFLSFYCLGAEEELGAGDRSRTYTGVSPEDFESSASAIPPLRHVFILGQDSLVGNFITITAAGESSFRTEDQRRTTCVADTDSTGGRVEKNFTAFLPMVLVVLLFHTA